MNKKTTEYSRGNLMLQQPYPFYYHGKMLWTISGIIFLMSWGFNYFFEPFEVYVPEHKMDFFWISVIHGLTTPLLLLLISIPLFNKSTEEKWTIKREIIFIGLILLLVGTVQFLIRDIIYDNPNNWSLKYFFEEIRNTAMVGILFISILVPLNFTRLNARHILKANALNAAQEDIKDSKNSMIEIKTNLKSDNITIDSNNLIFAKAEGNYVELYLKEENIKRVVKRITIKELESILSPFSNIIKTHRSFLVNLIHVEQVSGNAQGYKLHLNNFDETIPVSRNMIAHFNSKMSRI